MYCFSTPNIPCFVCFVITELDLVNISLSPTGTMLSFVDKGCRRDPGREELSFLVSTCFSCRLLPLNISSIWQPPASVATSYPRGPLPVDSFSQHIRVWHPYRCFPSKHLAMDVLWHLRELSGLCVVASASSTAQTLHANGFFKHPRGWVASCRILLAHYLSQPICHPFAT